MTQPHRTSGWERLAYETQERFPAPAWQTAGAQEESVAVATRARIARNIALAPFPHHATVDERRAIAEQLRPLVRKAIVGRTEAFSMASLREEEREYLIGQRLISPHFAQSRPHSWLIVDAPRSVGVLINEEDHLRVQVLLAGCRPDDAFECASRVADRVGECAPYAYRTQTGYLTASPYNCGHGIRLSVMLHLIALSSSGAVAAAITAATSLGIAARGLYGEGSRAVGGYFQLSSIGSYAEPCQRAAERLLGTARYLMAEELRARNELNRSAIEQHVRESLNALKTVPSLRFTDCLRILSWIRLGAVEQMLGTNPKLVDRWAALMEIGARNSEAMNRRRARFLRHEVFRECAGP